MSGQSGFSVSLWHTLTSAIVSASMGSVWKLPLIKKRNVFLAWTLFVFFLLVGAIHYSNENSNASADY